MSSFHIEPADLKIDVFSNASDIVSVRITHLPTGMVETCVSYSTIVARRSAMRRLAQRLTDIGAEA